MICAHAVSVTFKKMPGVQSVDVSLNKGLATVKLAVGNTARLEDFWAGVRKNGFTPKDTKVTAQGAILTSGKPQLKISGSNEMFNLQASSEADVSRHSGETVVIEGVITPSKNSKASPPIRVTAVRPVQKGA